MINKSKNNKNSHISKRKRNFYFSFFINKTYIPRFPTRNLPSKHLNTILNYGRTQSHQRLARVVSLLGRRFYLTHTLVSISCIRIGFGRLEIRYRSSTASGRNHTQKQGNTPKRKQNHRLSLLDTGRHEFWRSVRHTVRDSHITGSRAISGVWL